MPTGLDALSGGACLDALSGGACLDALSGDFVFDYLRAHMRPGDIVRLGRTCRAMRRAMLSLAGRVCSAFPPRLLGEQGLAGALAYRWAWGCLPVRSTRRWRAPPVATILCSLTAAGPALPTRPYVTPFSFRAARAGLSWRQRRGRLSPRMSAGAPPRSD